MIKEIDNEAISHVYHTFDGNTYYNQKTLLFCPSASIQIWIDAIPLPTK